MERVGPEWFYSSLSQVTAALVGFIGGFVIIRLSQVVAEWRDVIARLKTREDEWVWARIYAAQVDATSVPDTGPYEGEQARAHHAVSRSWSALYEVIEEQRSARFPFELIVTAIFLIGFLFVGTVWPLSELEEPGSKLRWLVPWSILLLCLFAAVFGMTWRVLWKLRATKLAVRTQTELEDYELQMEAWRDREESEDGGAD